MLLRLPALGLVAPLEHRARLRDVVVGEALGAAVVEREVEAGVVGVDEHAADPARAAVVGGAQLHRDGLADGAARSARACAADVRARGCSPRARTDRRPASSGGASSSGEIAWVASAIASRSTPPSRSISTRSTRAAPAAADLDVVEVEAEAATAGASDPHDRVDVDHRMHRLSIARSRGPHGKKKRGLAPTSPLDRWGPVGLSTYRTRRVYLMSAAISGARTARTGLPGYSVSVRPSTCWRACSTSTAPMRSWNSARCPWTSASLRSGTWRWPGPSGPPR